jgi:hypothetical protein
LLIGLSSYIAIVVYAASFGSAIIILIFNVKEVGCWIQFPWCCMGLLSILMSYFMAYLFVWSIFINDFCGTFHEFHTDNAKFTEYKKGMNMFFHSSMTAGTSSVHNTVMNGAGNAIDIFEVCLFGDGDMVNKFGIKAAIDDDLKKHAQGVWNLAADDTVEKPSNTSEEIVKLETNVINDQILAWKDPH